MEVNMQMNLSTGELWEVLYLTAIRLDYVCSKFTFKVHAQPYKEAFWNRKKSIEICSRN